VADVFLAAICGATAGLARAGLLDNIPHTSNALEYLQVLNYGSAALYQHQSIVTAGNVITANSTAPLEFAVITSLKNSIYMRLQFSKLGMGSLRQAISRITLNFSN
jgi:putative intracellular protease/amidase